MTRDDFDRIEERLKTGGNIRICNSCRVFLVTSKAYWAWRNVGRPLLKWSDKGLWMARGRTYDFFPFGTFAVQDN